MKCAFAYRFELELQKQTIRMKPRKQNKSPLNLFGARASSINDSIYTYNKKYGIVGPRLRQVRHETLQIDKDLIRESQEYNTNETVTMTRTAQMQVTQANKFHQFLQTSEDLTLTNLTNTKYAKAFGNDALPMIQTKYRATNLMQSNQQTPIYQSKKKFERLQNVSRTQEGFFSRLDQANQTVKHTFASNDTRVPVKDITLLTKSVIPASNQFSSKFDKIIKYQQSAITPTQHKDQFKVRNPSVPVRSRNQYHSREEQAQQRSAFINLRESHGPDTSSTNRVLQSEIEKSVAESIDNSKIAYHYFVSHPQKLKFQDMDMAQFQRSPSNQQKETNQEPKPVKPKPAASSSPKASPPKNDSRTSVEIQPSEINRSETVTLSMPGQSEMNVPLKILGNQPSVQSISFQHGYIQNSQVSIITNGEQRTSNMSMHQKNISSIKEQVKNTLFQDRHYSDMYHTLSPSEQSHTRFNKSGSKADIALSFRVNRLNDYLFKEEDQYYDGHLKSKTKAKVSPFQKQSTKKIDVHRASHKKVAIEKGVKHEPGRARSLSRQMIAEVNAAIHMVDQIINENEELKRRNKTKKTILPQLPPNPTQFEKFKYKYTMRKYNEEMMKDGDQANEENTIEETKSINEDTNEADCSPEPRPIKTDLVNPKFVKGRVQKKVKTKQLHHKQQLIDFTNAIRDVSYKIKKQEQDIENFRDTTQFGQVDVVNDMTQQDQGFRKKVDGIKPEIKAFFNDLLKEVHVKTEKLKKLDQLKQSLNQVLIKKTKFQMQIQKDQAMRQINTNLFKFFDNEVGALIEELAPGRSNSPGLKKKINKLQVFTKRHLMKYQNKGKINIEFLQKILVMQDVLDDLYAKRMNLGAKYMKGANVWRNTYLQSIKLEVERNFQEKKMDLTRHPKDMDNFQALFEEQYQKLQFFSQVKVINGSNEVDHESKAHMSYYTHCQSLKEVPIPAFAKIQNQCLFLLNFNISDQMSIALYEYLKTTATVPDKQIKKLYIDDCGMTNFQFCHILQGIRSQGKFINSIVYSSGDLGTQSVEQLVQIIPYLSELTLSNIRRGQSKQLIDVIIEGCLTQGFLLQKLKLTNINLNDNSVVLKLSEIIQYKRLITYLDLSWACLSPKHMVWLSEELKQNPSHIRCLNLSYNTLNFDPAKKDYDLSCEFMDNLCQFLENAKILHHLDLSGLQLRRDQLIRICSEAAIAHNLQGLHLCDNSIRSDKELMFELLDFFGISSDDLHNLASPQLNRQIQNPEALKSLVKAECQSIGKEDVINEKSKIESKQYIDHITLAKQSKAVANSKILNKTSTSQGIGKVETSMMDNFVLSRKMNIPEFIFNQHTQEDQYFMIDAAERWQLSDRSECFVCEKHRYTCLFYNCEEENPDFVEIKDPEMINQIKENLNINVNDPDQTSPYICGTLVKGLPFSRKLRMLRSDFYTLLSLCHSKEFVRSAKEIQAIKQGIMQICTDTQDTQMQDVLDSIKGWQRVLQDKLLQNELMDMHLINMPKSIPEWKIHYDEWDEEIQEKECSSFVFADFLPPGLHKLIIYCPKSQRAFCKEFISDLNGFEQYPDMPAKFQDPKSYSKRPKPKCNVWRLWKQEVPDTIRESFENDTMLGACNASKLIDGANALKTVNSILKENYSAIQVVFQELQAKNESTYPEITPKSICESILEQIEPEKKQKGMSEEEIMDACHQVVKVAKESDDEEEQEAKESLCRGEYLEALIRIACNKYGNLFVHKYFSTFITDFINPVFSSSSLGEERKMIQGSKRLNLLLHNNKEQLQLIYRANEIENQGFTMESVEQVFGKLLGEEPLVENIFSQFAKSKMLNTKDQIDPHCYSSLTFTEFLMLVCRLGHFYYLERKKNLVFPVLIEDRVETLVQMIWEQYSKAAKATLKKGEELPELWSLPKEGDSSDGE